MPVRPPFLAPMLVAAALIALPLVVWGLPSRAETVTNATLPSITVTGEGRVEAEPDMATVTLGVTTEGLTAAEAMDANSAALAAVLDRLRAAGVAERDLQTSGLSLNPTWSNPEGGRQRIEGFQAANLLTVRVRALDNLGSVLDAAIRDGANTLHGVTFGLDDPQPVIDRARERAVTDARRKAEQLAGAAGLDLGRVLVITEGGGGAMPPVPQYRMDAMASVPVAAGEVSMSVAVTVVWQIAERP